MFLLYICCNYTLNRSVKQQNMKEITNIMLSVFLKSTNRFFAENPSFQKLFPEFKDLEYGQLEQAKALHGHGKRVVKALENAVLSLDDSEAFASYLEELGRRHVVRALRPEYLEVTAVYFTESWLNLKNCKIKIEVMMPVIIFVMSVQN